MRSLAESTLQSTLPQVEQRYRVLVTLPVYNEVERLRGSVEALYSAMIESGLDFRVAIAEDGSTDGTQELIKEIQRDYPTLVVQSNPLKRGRGWALRTLWSRLRADLYAFSDADFAADARFLVEGLRIAMCGSDIVIGSRYVPGARVSRPPVRRMVSASYNILVRLIFRDNVRDHQCGLKVFSREAVRTLLPLSHEDSWFWDTEMVVLGSELGLSLVEFPVRWVERKAERTELRRLASDLQLHGMGLVRLAGRRGHVVGETVAPPIGVTMDATVQERFLIDDSQMPGPSRNALASDPS